MKIKVVLMMMLLMASVCFGQAGRGRYSGTPASVTAMENANSVYINDSTDPNKAYEALIARTDMGTLSATNRRTLILMPGVYNLTSTWPIDTDYVDVVSVSGNPEDTVVVRGTGGATVTQTANDVRLRGFTIKQTAYAAGDHALLLSPSSANTASVYTNMKFTAAATSATCQYVLSRAVYSTKDLGGTWEDCGDLTQDYLWSCPSDNNITGTFRRCYGRDHCWIMETPGNGAGVLSGTWSFCIANDHSYGGSFEICASYGNSITGTMEFCTGGNRCFAKYKTISGTVRYCTGKAYCFAAGGTISGVVEYNKSIGGLGDFGKRGISGTVRYNMIAMSEGTTDYDLSSSVAGLSTDNYPITDNGAYATLITDLGSNKDITYTAKYKGTWGNNLRIYYFKRPSGVVSVSEANGSLLQINVGTVTPTADNIISKIQAYPTANAMVTVAEGPGDGTGSITADYGPVALSGGIDSPVVWGNCTTNVIHEATGRGITAIYNGCKFTNKGAGGAVTITIHKAYVGWEYEFTVAANQELRLQPYYVSTTCTYDDDGGADPDYKITGTFTGVIVGDKVRITNTGAGEHMTAAEYEVGTIGSGFICLTTDPADNNDDTGVTVEYGDSIFIGSSRQEVTRYITANAIGERCVLKCITAGQWEQPESVGTWTVEP